MDRDIPVASRLCFEQSFYRSYLIHQHKMATYKPMIDNKPPPQVYFLRKRFDDVISKAKIDRDNRNLVQKIESIFEHGHHLSLKKEIKRHADKYVVASGGTARRPNLYEINKENQSMLNRLNNQTSPYSHKRYIKERKKVYKNISLISTFRVKKKSQRRTRMAGWFKEMMQTTKKYNTVCRDERYNSENVLFNKCQDISGKYYYVEIAVRGDHFSINVENVYNDMDRYQLKLDRQQGEDLLECTFEGNVQDMVNCIVINAQLKQCYIQCLKQHLKDDELPQLTKPEKTLYTQYSILPVKQEQSSLPLSPYENNAGGTSQG